MNGRIGIVAATILACCSAPAVAATVTVEMRNTGPTGVMVFVPDYVQVAPGDTVVFKSLDSGHNAVTIPGMLPDGAAEIAGKIGETVSATLTRPGLYGIKCVPHVGLGMVALVKVGKTAPNTPAATAAAATLPPLSRTKMQGLLAKAK